MKSNQYLREKRKIYCEAYILQIILLQYYWVDNPASGKTQLALRVQEQHPNTDFLVVNGDEFRTYHPDALELIKDNLSYSEKTQIFSNVFTEKLIEESIKQKFNIIVEGTMRNKNTPLTTAKFFKEAGFSVEAYIIAAPVLFTEIGIFIRYQHEVNLKGFGRLADINSHNEAVNGILLSADALYHQTAVDKISIYSFCAKEKIKDFIFNGKTWNCNIVPSEMIVKSREKQLRDTLLLSQIIKAGEETMNLMTDEYLKKSVMGAVNQLKKIERKSLE